MVAGLDPGIGSGHDDLAIPDQRPDLHSHGKLKPDAGWLEEPGALVHLHLDDLAKILAQRVQRLDGPTADVAEHRRHGDGARADHGPDPQAGDQLLVGALVDQGDGPLAPDLLGEHRREDVGLVIIGHRDQGVLASGVGFLEQPAVQRVAQQHGGPRAQHAGNVPGTLLVALDDVQVDAGEIPGDPRGQVQAHVAAAHEQHAPGHPLVMAEERHRRIQAIGGHDRMDVVTNFDPVPGVRNEHMALPRQRHDGQALVDFVGGDVLDTLADGGAVHVQHVHGQQLHQAARHGDDVECPGRDQAPGDAPGHLRLGRNDHVDGQVLGRVQPLRVPGFVARVAQPGKAALDVEKGVGHLAGNHVHLVRTGDGDEHVGVHRPGRAQDFRMRPVTHDAPDVVALVDEADPFGVRIDDGDTDALGRQVACDRRPDLAGSADDDPHAGWFRRLPPWIAGCMDNGYPWKEPERPRPWGLCRRILHSAGRHHRAAGRIQLPPGPALAKCFCRPAQQAW